MWPPSCFPIHSAYKEGWALYAESLGFEMGLYNDPYDQYGYYSSEVYRACRLVVDTGMNALDWTMEQGLNYMLEHSAASREYLEFEVKR